MLQKACMILSQSLALQNMRVTLFFSFYLNVEINVGVLASVYEKLTKIRKDEYDRVSY